MGRVLISDHPDCRNIFANTDKAHPNTFRVSIRMRDPVNASILKSTFGTAVRRYPYFLVKVENDGGGLYLADNTEPVVIQNSKEPVTLGGRESNYHLLAVSWLDDQVFLDVYMGISGKAGIYQLVRTFLYYYCSKYYHTTLSSCRIRFTGETPAEGEWDEALAKVNAAPDAVEAEGRLRTFRMRVPEAELLEKAGEKNLCSYAAQLFEKAAEKTGAEVQNVSFMGMAEYDDAEQFVAEYHINSQELYPGEPVRTALEFTDMNGFFYFDIEQRNNDPGLAEAFAAEIRNEEMSCEVLGFQEVKTAQLSEELLCIIA